MRYTGSVNRKSRRLGFSLLENNKEFSKGKKRTSPPGQHGARRGKPSEYKLQLTEKQKFALLYGMNDRQFKRMIQISRKLEGSNTENLVNLLESRADSLVFKMGFAATRRAARQLVNHGHVLINGKKVRIPSYICEPGDTIEIKEASKALPVVKARQEIPTPAYVEVNSTLKTGKYIRHPESAETNQEMKPALVIEYYNRLV